MSREEIRSLMSRAERSVRSARKLLEDGDHDFAASRAYYGMFYAATAALLSRGVTRSRHSGLVAAFGEHLVKAGKFTPEHQRALQAAMMGRTKADYAGDFPAREDVERRLEEARHFLDAVAGFLEAEGFQV